MNGLLPPLRPGAISRSVPRPSWPRRASPTSLQLRAFNARQAKLLHAYSAPLPVSMSDVPPHTLLVTRHTFTLSHVHTSHLAPHTSHLAPHIHIHTSHLHFLPLISHLTPHTSHLTPHSSLLTPHTSHLTLYTVTSHLTPHTQPRIAVPLKAT